MITRLKVQGFKSLLDVEVELGRLTVLVGPNGCGKTSVLEAIQWLRGGVYWFETGSRDDYPGEQGLKRVASRQGDGSIGLDVTITAGTRTYEMHTRFAGPEPEATVAIVGRKPLPLIKDQQLPEWAHGPLGGIGMYRLSSEEMAKPVVSDEVVPELKADGSNLAAVLDALQGEARERFDEIERRLCGFVPALERVKSKRAQVPSSSLPLIGHQVAFDFTHAKDINADQASEGTLLLLGLLTIIETKRGSDVTIMLDDLDRALHPKAQHELVEYLHRLIEDEPGLQIIATTHSPYLVEHLHYEEVLAITQKDDGTSVIVALNDHPDAARWREEMSAGEFWSSVGEDWAASARS